MKKLISVFLVFLATWQIIGFFTYFEWEKYHIRKDLKRVIKLSVPKETLKEFHFTFDEVEKLTWTKSNEFKINDRMYDVVYSGKTKTGYHFYCVDDIQETVLFANLDNSIANNLGSDSPLKHWIKLLKKPLIAQFKKVSPKIEMFIPKEYHQFIYASDYSELHCWHDSPPPQF